MFYLILSIIGILFTIFFVIGTHEFAHFLVARLFGIKVLRFSIGFGKRLFSWHDRSGTEYVFALIPLGGYVKMLDEREETVSPIDLPYSFNQQAFYKKFLVVLAGPLMNLLCAFILYWIILMIGFTAIKPIIGEVMPQSIAAAANVKAKREIIKINHTETNTWKDVLFGLLNHVGDHNHLILTTKALNSNTTYQNVLNLHQWQLNDLTPDLLSSLGIVPYQPKIPLTIGIIEKESPAEKAGLKIGDKIIAINGAKIKDWVHFLNVIVKHPNQTISLTIKRKQTTQTMSIHLGSKLTMLFQRNGFLGVSPKVKWPDSFLLQVHYGPIEALPHAYYETVNLLYFNFLLLGKLAVGKISFQSLGGPITIFESAAQAFNLGVISFLGFLAFLSIAVAVINVLPIPGLDGGHLLIYAIEAILQKPISTSILIFLYRVGFLTIFFILLQALINDVLRLF